MPETDPPDDRLFRADSQRGSTLVLVLVGLTLVASLSAAFLLISRTNTQNSAYVYEATVLRAYAQSAARVSLFELNNGANHDTASLGASSWSGSDVGRDGMANTQDLGEGDGVPTFGEPGVTPFSIGAAQLGARAHVWVESTAFPNVVRIVSEAYTDRATSTVEVFAEREDSVSLPPGANFLDPSVFIKQFDGEGLDGNDTNLDGSAGSNPATFGLATQPGSPSGSNAAKFLAEINSGEHGSIIGEGGGSSVGEATQAVDIDTLFTALESLATVTYMGGDPNNAYCGYANKPEITLFKGDKWTLSGSGYGSGILLVEANEFTSSGGARFDGLIIARIGKKCTFSGGPDPHVFGQFMMKGTLAKPPEYKQSGGSKNVYSVEGLQFALQTLTSLGLNPGAGNTSLGTYSPLLWEY